MITDNNKHVLSHNHHFSTIMTESYLSGVKIISASEANADSLRSFYKIMYPSRYDFLKDNWTWLNRSDYLNNRSPLVVVNNDQVIGHGGLIPVDLLVNNKTITATWLIDLAVLHEFRGQGLGNMLVKKRMEFAEMQMTFPNENSYRIFEASDWIKSSNGFMHYIIILPFNHPKFIKWLPSVLRWVLNMPIVTFLGFTYRKYAKHNTDHYLRKMDDLSLELLLKQYKDSPSSGNELITPIRDEEYVNWRIKSSPNRERYYIYSAESFSGLIYFNESGGNCIDILWLSDSSKMNEIRTMISTIALFGKEKGFAFLRFYTTRNKLSGDINRHLRSILKTRRFYFTSRNKDLLKECQQYTWDLELIDSDFEHTN